VNQIYAYISCGAESYRVGGAVGRGALAPRDAEAQALVVAHQAGAEPLAGLPGARLQQEGQPAAPPLAGEVVVLGPQRRGGDGVLRLHHVLAQDRHGDGDAGAAQRLHRHVVFGAVEVHAVHLEGEGHGERGRERERERERHREPERKGQRSKFTNVPIG